jgi:RNA polymerase sigma-70 factor (ECF subfamily)
MTDAVNRALGEYRAYLETLTCIQIDPRLRNRVGWSDVIQETWLEAWKDLARIEQLDEPARKRWLRRMLVNNLRDMIRKILSAGRDVRLEQSLEAAAAGSSCRVDHWLAIEDTSPGDQMARQEGALQLLEALSKLDARQREALILQKYHGWTLAQTAEHLGCSTGAVAGLHARGLKKLREFLPALE